MWRSLPKSQSGSLHSAEKWGVISSLKFTCSRYLLSRGKSRTQHTLKITGWNLRSQLPKLSVGGFYGFMVGKSTFSFASKLPSLIFHCCGWQHLRSTLIMPKTASYFQPCQEQVWAKTLLLSPDHRQHSALCILPSIMILSNQITCLMGCIALASRT